VFARITAIQIQPSRLNDMRDALPALSTRLKAVPGMVECKVCWNDSGQGQVFALYDSPSHAEAASDTIRSVWGGLSHLLAAPPTSSTGTEVHDLLK
jgi:hypothetical protein